MIDMAHFINNSWCKIACVAAIALPTLSSCITDDLDGCPSTAKNKVALSFNYTYNVKDANAFASEVKDLNVYVFDQNGKFYDVFQQSQEKFSNDYQMEVQGLQNGKYTFVCLARDKQPAAIGDGGETEFSFTTLTPGQSTVNELTEKMGSDQQEEIENNKRFSALYTAQQSVVVTDTAKVTKADLSLMKCTKTYRIVMMPYKNDQTGFVPENFDVRIKGSAAWLDYKGDKVENDPITYTPFNAELRTSADQGTVIEGQPIDKAIVYDLSSSRMFERGNDVITRTDDGKIANDKRIVITDKRSGQEVFNHSLPWFLALCGERDDNSWGAQEYLDRQDHYVLTFYVPDERDYNLSAKVNVNGWVLNLQDTELGAKPQVRKASASEMKSINAVLNKTIISK